MADEPRATVTANVGLKMPGGTLRASMTVPSGPTSLIELIPMAQGLANAITDIAVRAVEAEGQTVSCRKGCGACCRQLVPISEVEARQIRDLVENLPEPRRSTIRARFDAARNALDAAGLLETIRGNARREGDPRGVALDYFAQGIACPFLEDESCSIHPDRPISCREYLVTSHAENCARPTAETVQIVPMPGSVWRALAKVDNPRKIASWVPLILALEWAEGHPEMPEPRPGPDLLRELIGFVVDATVPPPPPPHSNPHREG